MVIVVRILLIVDEMAKNKALDTLCAQGFVHGI
nr:MAG TPA: Urease subunit beta-alpha linker domain [Herelleviridae sp.]